MEVSTLHLATEDLASFLSEASLDDLSREVHGTSMTLWDLYGHLVREHASVARTINQESVPAHARFTPLAMPSLEVPGDPYGSCGLETPYRHAAQLMERAFAAARPGARCYQLAGSQSPVSLTTLYDLQVSNLVAYTWDVAQTLGLPYRPSQVIARGALQND